MRPAQPWRFEPTLRFLAVLPLSFALAALVIELLSRVLGETGPPASRPAWLLASGTGAVHLITLGLLVPLLRAHGLTWRAAFGFGERGWKRPLLIAATLTVPAMAGAWALHQGSGWILDQFHITHDTQTAVDAVRNASGRPWELVVLGFFTVGTAPVVEEILFRGILWPLARNRGWRRSGSLAVALLFALIHLNAAAFLPLAALGLFWIWLYEHTDDLLAPIVSHAVFNAVNFVWIAYYATQTATHPS